MEATTKSKKTDTLALTQLGIFSGIIILLTFTPIGMISFGVISATTVHIPVIIGAVVLGVKGGMILGGVMGIASLLRALLMPVTVLDPLFINPIISVLPRIALGLVAALVFIGIKKLIKNKASTPIAAGIAAAAGALTNTILVLGTLALIYGQQIQIETPGQALTLIIGTIIGTNGIIEILSGVILTIPISMALFKIKKNLTIS